MQVKMGPNQVNLSPFRDSKQVDHQERVREEEEKEYNLGRLDEIRIAALNPIPPLHHIVPFLLIFFNLFIAYVCWLACLLKSRIKFLLFDSVSSCFYFSSSSSR
jgi:hypothetical protein